MAFDNHNKRKTDELDPLEIEEPERIDPNEQEGQDLIPRRTSSPKRDSKTWRRERRCRTVPVVPVVLLFFVRRNQLSTIGIITLILVAATGLWIENIRSTNRFFDDSCSTTRRPNVSPLPGDPTFVPTNVTWTKMHKHDPSVAPCCPYAKVLYRHKYKFVDYRCCRDHDMAHTLRALGGGTWTSQSRAWNILLQGDSLAEQHFLSLLCRAWQEGLSVRLRHTSVRSVLQRLRPQDSPAYKWRAYIGKEQQPQAHVVTFLRTNLPVVSPQLVNYDYYDYTFVGGWHHNGVAVTQELMEPHVRHIPRLVWVEALPSHFYHPPKSTGADHSVSAVCQNVTQPRGTPDVNDELTVWFPTVPVLRAAHLYQNASALHVGYLGHGHARPDCLHWCVPSLDAWARQTLLWLCQQNK